MLVGETLVPLWDAPAQWEALKEAFRGETLMRWVLVPFGPRLGEMYTAYQRDPIPRTAVNARPRPPLTAQQIIDHGDLSYWPETISFTGDCEERAMGLEQLESSPYSLTNSEI